MTETSNAKTARKLISLLEMHNWKYQLSIFSENINESEILAENYHKITQGIRKREKASPILIIKRTHYDVGHRKLQAYITIFSSKDIKKTIESACEGLPIVTNTLKQKVSDLLISRTCNAYRKQKLQNLHQFYGKKARRYSILNKTLLASILKA